MSENWEDKNPNGTEIRKIKLPKNFWRIVEIVVFSLMVIFNLYVFGIKPQWIKYKDGIYQKGVNDANMMVLKNLTTQFVNTQQLQIPIIVNPSGVPDANGTATIQGIFILKPQ